MQRHFLALCAALLTLGQFSCSGPFLPNAEKIASPLDRSAVSASVKLYLSNGQIGQAGNWTIAAQYRAPSASTVHLEWKDDAGETFASDVFDVEAGAGIVRTSVGMGVYQSIGSQKTAYAYIHPRGLGWEQRWAEDRTASVVVESSTNDRLVNVGVPATVEAGASYPIALEYSARAAREIVVRAIDPASQTVWGKAIHTVSFETDGRIGFLDVELPLGLPSGLNLTWVASMYPIGGTEGTPLVTRSIVGSLVAGSSAPSYQDSLAVDFLPRMTKNLDVPTLRIGYSASADRDLLVDFYDQNASWKWIAGTRTPVSTGKGTANVAFAIPANLTPGSEYAWIVRLVPRGADYTKALRQTVQSNVQVNRAAFDAVEWRSTPAVLSGSSGFAVTVGYSAPTARTLRVELKDASTYAFLSGHAISIPAGIGTVSATLTPPFALVPGKSYLLYTYSFLPGQGWANRLAEDARIVVAQ